MFINPFLNIPTMNINNLFIAYPLSLFTHLFNPEGISSPVWRLATLTMVFKLVLETKKTWKKIKGYRLIPKVLRGVTFIDGELADEGEQVA